MIYIPKKSIIYIYAYVDNTIHLCLFIYDNFFI